MRKLLLVGLLFLFPSIAHSQGSLVNTDGWQCTSACASHTLAVAAAAGNLVVVYCNSIANSGTCGTTMASSPSYTWTHDDAGSQLSTWYICPGTNTSGVTSVTPPGTAKDVMSEVEVSSIVSASCKDISSNGASNTGTTWASNSITTTNALDFILAVSVSNVSASGFTVSAPYTQAQTFQATGSVVGTNLSAYHNVSSTGANSASGNTPTGNTQDFTDIIAFKANAAAAGTSGFDKRHRYEILEE